MTGRKWDFGDNTSSEDQNPKHSYSKEDVYTVSLSVFNDDGKVNTLTRVAYIEITNDVEPTPTSDQQTVDSLTVNPESADKSFRLQQATVTAFDENGDPIKWCNY